VSRNCILVALSELVLHFQSQLATLCDRLIGRQYQLMIKRSRTKTVPTGACLILAFPNPDIGWDKVKPEVDRALLASGAAAVEESFDPGTQKRNRTRGGICCDDSISEYSDISDEEILLLARSENRMPSTLSEPGTSAPVSHLDGRHLQASPRQDCQPLSAFNTISILKEMEDSKKISSVSYAKAMTDDGLFSVDCVVVTLEGLKIHESGTAKSKKEAKSFAAAKVHKALTSCLNEERAAVNDVALSLAETNVHEAPATSNGSMSYRTALHSEGDRGGGENESDSASSHIYGEMPSYRDDSTVCSLSSLPRNLPIFISLLKEMEDSKKISSVSYAKAMTDDGLFSVDCVVVTLEGLKIHESGIAKSKKEAKSFAAAKVHKALTSCLNEECAAVNDVALSLAETNVHEAPATSNGSMSYRTALHSEGDRGGGENESDSASSHIYDEMSSYRDDSTQSSPALTMSKNCISLLKEMEDSMKILSVSYTEANDAVGLYTITCTATSLKEYRISGYSTANSKKVAKFSAAAKVYAYLCMERSAHAASDDASGESLKSTEMHRVPDDSDNSIGNLKELVDHNAIESVTYSDAELRSDGYFSVVCTVIKAAGLEITCSGAAANKKQAKKEAAWKALGAF